MKLTAVLNASIGDMPGACVGLSGSTPCSRRIRYSSMLDGVLEVDDAEDPRAFGDDQGRAAARRDPLHDRGEVAGDRAAAVEHPVTNGVGRALADAAARLSVRGGQVDAAHPRLRGERDE